LEGGLLNSPQAGNNRIVKEQQQQGSILIQMQKPIASTIALGAVLVQTFQKRSLVKPVNMQALGAILATRGRRNPDIARPYLAEGNY